MLAMNTQTHENPLTVWPTPAVTPSLSLAQNAAPDPSAPAQDALPILNLATYRFVAIDDLDVTRDWVRTRCEQFGIKGTILLAAEGVNLFVAGQGDSVRAWLAEMDTDARFAHLGAKESWSKTVPYRKLVVKVRKEIIRMDQPGIVQQHGRAPAVDAATLKRWLDAGVDDAGKPVVMLDTRNQFEVDMGTFDGAVSWNIARFSEFPAATDAHALDLDNKTVVSFCTGGIRCEKAAIYLRHAGVDAYQLEGGILKYFETQQSAHYTGHCFVFDDRALVDGALQQVGDYPPDTQFNPKKYQ